MERKNQIASNSNDKDMESSIIEVDNLFRNLEMSHENITPSVPPLSPPNGLVSEKERAILKHANSASNNPSACQNVLNISIDSNKKIDEEDFTQTDQILSKLKQTPSNMFNASVERDTYALGRGTPSFELQPFKDHTSLYDESSFMKPKPFGTQPSEQKTQLVSSSSHMQLHSTSDAYVEESANQTSVSQQVNPQVLQTQLSANSTTFFSQPQHYTNLHQAQIQTHHPLTNYPTPPRQYTSQPHDNTNHTNYPTLPTPPQAAPTAPPNPAQSPNHLSQAQVAAQAPIATPAAAHPLSPCPTHSLPEERYCPHCSLFLCNLCEDTHDHPTIKVKRDNLERLAVGEWIGKVCRGGGGICGVVERFEELARVVEHLRPRVRRLEGFVARLRQGEGSGGSAEDAIRQAMARKIKGLPCEDLEMEEYISHCTELFHYKDMLRVLWQPNTARNVKNEPVKKEYVAPTILVDSKQSQNTAYNSNMIFNSNSRVTQRLLSDSQFFQQPPSASINGHFQQSNAAPIHTPPPLNISHPPPTAANPNSQIHKSDLTQSKRPSSQSSNDSTGSLFQNARIYPVNQQVPQQQNQPQQEQQVLQSEVTSQIHNSLFDDSPQQTQNTPERSTERPTIRPEPPLYSNQPKRGFFAKFSMLANNDQRQNIGNVQLGKRVPLPPA